MIVKVDRNYLEINSIRELNYSKKPTALSIFLYRVITNNIKRQSLVQHFYIVKINEEGKVVEHKFEPARYRITYEDI